MLETLHPLELRFLLEFPLEEPFVAQDLLEKLQFNQGQVNQVLSWLLTKGLIVEENIVEERFYEISPSGLEALEKGTLFEKLVERARQQAFAREELEKEWSVDAKDFGKALGILLKERVLRFENGFISFSSESTESPHKVFKSLLQEASKDPLRQSVLTQRQKDLLSGFSKKRGLSSTSLFRIVDSHEVTYRALKTAVLLRTEIQSKGLTGHEETKLTSEMLRNGSWKGIHFRAYDVEAPSQRVLLGRSNPYGQYLHFVRQKLLGLGFTEFDGPLVQTEFWNNDALFMPQFHAARDIHDVYYIKEPTHARSIEEPYLSRVAEAHEHGGSTSSRGWRYAFDKNFTRRLLLRSHGTALSARVLPQALSPSKYFGIARCFRYDQVDATHGADFYQTDGIVVGKDLNLGHLLGLLELFAKEIAGAQEVRYVPAYFPFTEPSIEVHVKHPHLGWFELGGSGIFRPELTSALGMEHPVLAWGLGIDRMALLALGLSDIRELFTYDIDKVRLRRLGHA